MSRCVSLSLCLVAPRFFQSTIFGEPNIHFGSETSIHFDCLSNFWQQNVETKTATAEAAANGILQWFPRHSIKRNNLIYFPSHTFQTFIGGWEVCVWVGGKTTRGMINVNFNQLPFICNLIPFFSHACAHACLFARACFVIFAAFYYAINILCIAH